MVKIKQKVSSDYVDENIGSAMEKLHQSRPKTSSKMDKLQNSNTQGTSTASTSKRTTIKEGQTKSFGEDSIKRLIKKSKSKPSSRPQSGNKKKGQPTSQSNYGSNESQSQQ